MIFDSTLWNLESPVWLVTIGILVAYWAAIRSAAARRPMALGIGLVLLVLAYISPVGVLADGYLFSAHMLQHLILLLAVPLCLILSVRCTDAQPATATEADSAGPASNARLAVICWICGVGAMWFWHVPNICTAASQNYALGAFRDVSFIAAGLAFWWPVYAPLSRFRLASLNGIGYLFSACSGCTLLGIYITFTTVSVCPAFANPMDRIGILNRLYDAGLTPGVDQNLGGLLMWVPPCTLYVCAIISLLSRWYSEIEHEPAETGQIVVAAQEQD